MTRTPAPLTLFLPPLTSPKVGDVNALEEEFAQLSDEQIKQRTEDMAIRAQKGESLDALLPEAFANVREAAKRALGLRAFDTQLMGGIFLHQGNISEMKTGEGKTLVACFWRARACISSPSTNIW